MSAVLDLRLHVDGKQLAIRTTMGWLLTMMMVDDPPRLLADPVLRDYLNEPERWTPAAVIALPKPVTTTDNLTRWDRVVAFNGRHQVHLRERYERGRGQLTSDEARALAAELLAAADAADGIGR